MNENQEHKQHGINVILLHHSPLWLASHAIRMSHDNHDKSDTGISEDPFDTVIRTGPKDRELIERVGNKLKHKSVLEQLVYWFDIDGISRACLQELARHRTARLTVQSSRYTLNKVLSKGVKETYVTTGNAQIDKKIEDTILAMANTENVSNDVLKYMLPEAFKTRLQWQIDGRNLQNFLELRTSKDALWEIRVLALAIYNILPQKHKYLYESYIAN